MYNICNAIDHVKEDSTVSDKTKHDLYMYRSTIQLMVKNQGYAIEDLKSALFYVDDIQSFSKLIDVYIEIEAYDKAKTLISNRLKKIKNIANEEEMKILLKKENEIKDLQNDLMEKLKKLQIFKNMENVNKIKLYEELTKRGIKLKPQIHNIPVNCQANVYTDHESKLHFPILIVYEEFNTTDYIQDIIEDSLVSDILEVLFQEKLPWDKENKYNTNTCICYYEISDIDPITKIEINYYFPLRNDDRLIDVLKHKKVHMNGFPVIVILSQISEHYTHFIKNKIIIKRK